MTSSATLCSTTPPSPGPLCVLRPGNTWLLHPANVLPGINPPGPQVADWSFSNACRVHRLLRLVIIQVTKNSKYQPRRQSHRQGSGPRQAHLQYTWRGEYISKPMGKRTLIAGNQFPFAASRYLPPFSHVCPDTRTLARERGGAHSVVRIQV